MLQKFVEQILRELGHEPHSEGALVTSNTPSGPVVIAFVAEGQLPEFLNLSRQVPADRIVVPSYPLSTAEEAALHEAGVRVWPREDVEDAAVSILTRRKKAKETIFAELA